MIAATVLRSTSPNADKSAPEATTPAMQRTSRKILSASSAAIAPLKPLPLVWPCRSPMESASILMRLAKLALASPAPSGHLRVNPDHRQLRPASAALGKASNHHCQHVSAIMPSTDKGHSGGTFTTHDACCKMHVDLPVELLETALPRSVSSCAIPTQMHVPDEKLDCVTLAAEYLRSCDLSKPHGCIKKGPQSVIERLKNHTSSPTGQRTA